MADSIPLETMVDCAGIEPAPTKKMNPNVFFVADSIPLESMVGSAGIEPAIFAM